MTRAVQEAHEASRVIKVYDGERYEAARFERINLRLRRFAMKMQVAWSAATQPAHPQPGHVACHAYAATEPSRRWRAR